MTMTAATTGRLAACFETLGEIGLPPPSVYCASWTLSLRDRSSDAEELVLGPDLLASIAGHLVARDLAAFGSTCATLALLAKTLTPGLKLAPLGTIKTLYPHQRASLEFMQKAEALPGQRGGILADEPGTGKTVTTLALLCKTAGMWTAPIADLATRRLEEADALWRTLPIAFRRDLVLKVLRDISERCPAGFATFRLACPTLPGYASIIGPPPLDYTQLTRDATIASFTSRHSFDDAVLAVPRAAHRYWSSASHPDGAQAAAALAGLAAELERHARAALDHSYPRATQRPPPLRSRATLLVVPRPLLPHWQEQIDWHVAAGALEGEVIVDGYGTQLHTNGRRPAGASASAPRLRDVFSAARLANAAIVITTSERLSLEQRYASLAEGEAANGEGARAPSVLCDVHWVRLICDEGHSLGGGSLTNLKVLLAELHAERRWILSGTPAKETSDAEGCGTIGGLLGFLGCAQRARWPAVSRAFLRRQPGSDAALVAFLQPLMVRQLKRKIQVPQPIRSTVYLDCSPGEKLAYNTIVGFTRANLVLTSLEGASQGAGADVSLLHHSNLKSARAAVDNIRQACNGGGKQVATLSTDFYDEARMWLVERYRAPAHAVKRATHFMEAVQAGHSLPCDRCGLPLLMLLVMPTCGHLCCAECVGDAGPNLEGCPACGETLPPVSYLKCGECHDTSVHCTHAGRMRERVELHPRDAFAWMQPGFDLQWAETLREAEARTLAERFAKQRREEIRHAASLGTAASHVATGFTLAPPHPTAASRASEPAIGAGAVTSSSSSAGAVAGSGSLTAAASGVSHTKAAHIIESIARLREVEREAREARAAGRRVDGHDGRPVKVAVYAESRRLLDQLGHFLYLRFGDDAVAQFWGKYRTTELDKFRSERVRYWCCTACPPRHEHPSGPPREVEFPEVRCYGKLLTVVVSGEHAPPGVALSGGVTSSFSLIVNEEDARIPGTAAFQPGTRWMVGQMVETRVRMPNGALSGWLIGRVSKFGKCGHRKGDDVDVPWKSRRAECFCLLLTRDGSHGLDLSMLTNLYLADQCWDPAVEAQVISRAFRMGATAPCRVEQLLMRGTVEHILHEQQRQPHHAPSTADPSRSHASAASSSAASSSADTGVPPPSAIQRSELAGEERVQVPQSPPREQTRSARKRPVRADEDAAPTPPTAKKPRDGDGASRCDATPSDIVSLNAPNRQAGEVAKVHHLLLGMKLLR